ncbi:hypothetical protein CHCC14814_4010 [Bacillus paralicheniformis]|nr:hypothetical protein CHCC14814_4010 [Bacillus paralicheniformis]
MPYSFHPALTLLYIEYGGRSDHAIDPTYESGSASAPFVFQHGLPVIMPVCY